MNNRSRLQHDREARPGDRISQATGVIRSEEPQAGPETAVNVSRAGVRAFRLGWTAFVVVATSLPYLCNFFSAPAGYHYTWILPPVPDDSFSYMAWSQQAAHGSLLFQLKYTALPHAPFLFQPFFLICGWLSWLFSCDIGIVHWVVKAMGVTVFLAAFYKYTDYLGLSGLQSVVASIFVGISSGVGGLLVLLGLANRLPVAPTDLWLVDANTFWSLLWNPLFPYSLTLMLLTIHWLDRGTRDARKSDFWLGGVATGVLALIHPYSQPLLFAFAVIITVLRRKADALKYLWRYFSILLPFALYVVLIAEFHPLISRHSSMGEMKSPTLAACALGFGLPLLLCAGGLAIGRGQCAKRYWQIILWFLLSMALAWLPFWFQRKLIFGAHVPLCILAAVSFDLVLARCFRPPARRWALAAAALILLPLLASTPAYLLASESREVRDNADGAYFISNDVMEGVKFLKQRSKPDEVVFASVKSSRWIPALSGNTVVWGHWAQSVDAEERLEWYAKLFHEQANWDEESRAREFWGSGIQYVFADGELKQALEQHPQAWRIILREADIAFANGSVVIYKHRSR